MRGMMMSNMMMMMMMMVVMMIGMEVIHAIVVVIVVVVIGEADQFVLIGIVIIQCIIQWCQVGKYTVGRGMQGG